MTHIVPMLALATSRNQFGGRNRRLLTVKSESGVGVRDLSEGRAPGQDLDSYRTVKSGDLVVNKLWARFGAYGVSGDEGVISPAYWVLRLDASQVVPRYLHYLLRSEPYKAEIGRISKNMPPNGFELAWDKFRRLQVPLESLTQQCGIADFLDAETTRIDAVVAKRQAMHALLAARIASFHEQWFADMARRYPPIPLRRFLATLEQGWSPVCEAVVAEPTEWGVLKTSAVSSGRFIATENKRLPDDQVPELRWRISDGDLLMTRGSGSQTAVGQVAVARTDGRRLMISDLVYRLRLTKAEPEFVAAALGSPQVRNLIEQTIRTDAGQTLKIRSDDIRGLPVPAVPTESQADVTSVLHAFQSAPSRVLEVSGRQVALLREHRQALITAAVAGEIDVSTASGRGVPA